MKILIVGYGKMGKAIEDLSKSHGHEIVGIVNEANELEAFLNSKTDTDVAIEFSSPESAVSSISSCLKSGIPVVSGTTGWLENMDDITQLVEDAQGAFFYAPNFSIGMNIVFELANKLGKGYGNFSQFKVSIQETHHPEKKDTPSGTAIKLANEFLNENTILREWGMEPASEEILPIEAKREEGEVGTHILKFESNMESFFIEHKAKDRKVFAQGAIKAAEFLQGKKGCFSMSDLLGF